MGKWTRMGFAFWLLAALAGCGAVQQVETLGAAEITESTVETAAEQQLVAEAKYLALTFDDGPRRGTTDVLLDGLKERGVAATFFVVGEQIQGNEDLLRRMKEEGHQIGNHTYSHTRLLDAAPETVVEEVQKTQVLLEQLTGEGDYWLRPPYGLIDESRAALVQTPMIYWSLDPEDWKLLDAQKVFAAVAGQVQPGDIILMHDFYPTSVEAALDIIDCLLEQGYRFVTVTELFTLYGVTPQTGKLYASPEQLRPLSS